MESKEIDLPGLGGAYFISVFLLWSKFAIKVIYGRAEKLAQRRELELLALLFGNT